MYGGHTLVALLGATCHAWIKGLAANKRPLPGLQGELRRRLKEAVAAQYDVYVLCILRPLRPG